MSKPVNGMRLNKAGSCGLMCVGSERFTGDVLVTSDVLNASEGPAIKPVNSCGHVSEHNGEYRRAIDTELCLARDCQVAQMHKGVHKLDNITAKW